MNIRIFHCLQNVHFVYCNRDLLLPSQGRNTGSIPVKATSSVCHFFNLALLIMSHNQKFRQNFQRFIRYRFATKFKGKDFDNICYSMRFY